MGTFAGHAIPGSAFLVWGVWWYGHTLRHISVSEAPARPADGGPKTSSSSSDGQLPMPRDGVWKAPVYFTKLEPALKLAVPAAALVGELWWASWRLVDSSVVNYQHATMYLFFVAAGATDFLEMKRALPAYAGRLALMLAFLFEGVLFFGHHDNSPLEATLHRILIYVILFQVLVLALEWRYRHVALSVIRCFGLILQGMWMLQIAYLLFYLRYDTANHTNVMRAHLFFAWHWLGLAILMYLTYWMVIKRRDSRQARTRLADT